WAERRASAGQSPLPQSRMQGGLLPLLGGFLAVVGIGVGPFVLAAPDRFVREVVLFQVLRPTDCNLVVANAACDPAGRIADLTANLQNGPTTALAALGFLVLTAWLVRRRSGIRDQGSPELPAHHPALSTQHSALLWRPVVLWSCASVL